jgi:hypothetical protein
MASSGLLACPSVQLAELREYRQIAIMQEIMWSTVAREGLAPPAGTLLAGTSIAVGIVGADGNLGVFS